MNGCELLYQMLDNMHIEYEYFEHPEAPTIEIAKQYWHGHKGKHCKNLFFRNHKGNRHYLVILDCDCDMDIHNLEKRLMQGKLSFASEQRMERYLGVKPGSVTPFGLINDTTHHVHTFLDRNLQQADYLCFHPCINTATLTVSQNDFIRFMDATGNTYEWIDVY